MKNSSFKKTLPRRRFLQWGALAATPIILPARLFGKSSPSNTLNVAITGSGTRCGAHLQMFTKIPGVKVVAVCDVWPKRTQERKKQIDEIYGDTHCKTYHDYREMIADPEVDIVTVAAPDHWHSLVAIEAANNGKQVYLEKPFAYSVKEGRAVIEAVTRNGVLLQVGTQQRSSRFFQRATYLAKRGYIGNVDKVYAISPIGPQGGDPTPIDSPSGLDYDFFTGPAPVTPYVDGLCERKGTPGWYFTSNFCGGWVTAWGSHHVDSAQWALGKDDEAPKSAEFKGLYPERGAWNTAWEWYGEYTYTDGKKLIYATANRSEVPGNLGNIVVVGDQGWVSATRRSVKSNPAHLAERVWPQDDPEFPQLNGTSDLDHFENFIDAIREGKRQNAPAHIGHLSTTLCHLTNIGIELDRPLEWDGMKERFVNDSQADRLLSRTMRAPWKMEV